ncbi:hypothetical protein RD792_012579 [Penstemon davidsonii]|uniref:Patatin n=1 Tax=Penstemon davidsonii TaxID=160366 RepID=A0ABR0CX95_9LAMI|nr:hypothetical protein RD792_012579 [Penstemon davidsonii]
MTTAAAVAAISKSAEMSTYEIFSILENKFLFGYDNNVEPSSSGRVRILSIDGGDGFLSAKALLHLQAILRRKSGNPNAHVADFFDVVAGSGVGGILAGLLFTPGKDGAPIFTAEESLRFIADDKYNNNNNNSNSSSHDKIRSLFRSRPASSSKYSKALNKVLSDSTLKDTLKAVLIPCYDLTTGAPFLFSRADALEMDGCDFKMSAVCDATAASVKPVELKSTDGRTKMVALGGGVAMNNPTAAAITHVLNNKQEFPLCKGLEDLMVVSIGNGEYMEYSTSTDHVIMSTSSPASSLLVRIAGDGAADMVDQAVSMAFGDQLRRNNYFRIQGRIVNRELIKKTYNSSGRRSRELMRADEMLGQKSVESVLFKGKKLVEKTNIEKLDIAGGELIKEQERRNKISILPNANVVVLKHYSSPRSSSATTLSTLSSS